MDFNKYISKAAQSVDMSKPKVYTGGESYAPPAEGSCMLRFVGYVEIGIQLENYQGQEKRVPKAMLVFELHGKNYPVKEINGEKVAQRITVKETISSSPKSNFFKLFNVMRGGTNCTHIAELLGRPYKGKVFHSKFQKDGKEICVAKLRDSTGYSIDLPTFEDPESGEVRSLNVPPQVTKTRLFLWDFADKEMWDNIILPGERQPFADAIRQALNYKGSFIESLDTGVELTEQEEVRAPAKVTSFRATGVANSPQPAAQASRPGFRRPPITVVPPPAPDAFDVDEVPY